ncbi:MAG: GyrI-like domain-containing protein [Clostridiaceae bacterium]|nr:GyrI-like domain-containing protein [Eubacteriales bacterium]
MSIFSKKELLPLTVELTELPFELMAVGRSKVTTEAGVYLDAQVIVDRYAKLAPQIKNKTAPYYNATVTFQKDGEGKFRYFVGTCVTELPRGKNKIDGAEEIQLPENTPCAKLVVQAKSVSGWPLALGRARQLFYETWLPQSGRRSHEIVECIELYGPEGRDRHPVMELYFPLA